MVFYCSKRLKTIKGRVGQVCYRSVRVLTQEGPPTNNGWYEVRRGSSVFLSRVYLVSRLIVPDTAWGFNQFESEMPMVISGGDVRTEKKIWEAMTLYSKSVTNTLHYYLFILAEFYYPKIRLGKKTLVLSIVLIISKRRLKIKHKQTVIIL